MADPTYLYPTFEVGVSLNGCVAEFILSPEFYIAYSQEEGVDPFSFTEVWMYISKHIHEYLFEFGVVEDVGPVDTDNLRLISLSIQVNVAPSQLKDVLDDENFERYNEDLKNRVARKIEEEDDDES